MRRLLTSLFVTAIVVTGLVVSLSSTEATPPSAASAFFQNTQTGNPGFQSMGRMSFGPHGLLLITDPQAAAVVAIDTSDRGPVEKLKARVDNVSALVAGSLGAKPDEVEIVDMAVNPKSGKIYLAVHRQADKQFVLLTFSSDGAVSLFDLDRSRYVRVTLPGGNDSKVKNITDVEFSKDRVLAAGQSSEEFASKIYSLPLPLTHGSAADIYSAETYHVAHRRWETRAPIQSFVPLVEDGKDYIVGSFSCTPIAKFPVGGLESGAQVKGESVVELGSGNRPLDMFTYKRNGKEWLVTNTFRFHHKRNVFGPSKWWGVRINMDYMSAKDVNEQAARRDVQNSVGPKGVEVLECLFGAVQVDKLSDEEIVVLRDNDGQLDLEVAQLP